MPVTDVNHKVYGCDNCGLMVHKTTTKKRPQKCSGCGGQCFTTIDTQQKKERFSKKRSEWMDNILCRP